MRFLQKALVLGQEAVLGPGDEGRPEGWNGRGGEGGGGGERVGERSARRGRPGGPAAACRLWAGCRRLRAAAGAGRAGPGDGGGRRRRRRKGGAGVSCRERASQPGRPRPDPQPRAQPAARPRRQRPTIRSPAGASPARGTGREGESLAEGVGIRSYPQEPFPAPSQRAALGREVGGGRSATSAQLGERRDGQLFRHVSTSARCFYFLLGSGRAELARCRGRDGTRVRPEALDAERRGLLLPFSFLLSPRSFCRTKSEMSVSASESEGIRLQDRRGRCRIRAHTRHTHRGTGCAPREAGREFTAPPRTRSATRPGPARPAACPAAAGPTSPAWETVARSHGQRGAWRRQVRTRRGEKFFVRGALLRPCPGCSVPLPERGLAGAGGLTPKWLSRGAPSRTALSGTGPLVVRLPQAPQRLAGVPCPKRPAANFAGERRGRRCQAGEAGGRCSPRGRESCVPAGRRRKPLCGGVGPRCRSQFGRAGRGAAKRGPSATSKSWRKVAAARSR